MIDLHELVLTRHLAAPPEAVWTAWRDHMTEWFAPHPWTTPEAEVELHPGGRFHTLMRSPEGQDIPGEGTVLACEPGRSVTWTDAFAPGWLPQGPFMVATMAFGPDGDGTSYTATVRHWTAEAKAQHEAMGFHAGWGVVADQLETVAKRIAAG